MSYSDQLYQTFLKEAEPSHYERMADCLDFITYISEIRNPETGEIIYQRKRLTPLEKDIYRIIKRSARDTVCFKGRDLLAFEANCSTGSITNAKRTLQMPFEQLDGESLISIEKRRVATYKNDKQINTRPNDVIFITPIWGKNREIMTHIFSSPENKRQYKEQYKCGELSKREAEVLIEKIRQSIQEKNVHNSGAREKFDSARGAEKKNDSASQRALSNFGITHTPYPQTPLCNTYSPFSDESEKRRECILKNDFVCRDAYEVEKWLVDFGVHKNVVCDIMSRYGWQSVYGRILEFKRHFNSKKIKKSIVGALLSHINIGRNNHGRNTR